MIPVSHPGRRRPKRRFLPLLKEAASQLSHSIA
jgi:hypothetical protein